VAQASHPELIRRRSYQKRVPASTGALVAPNTPEPTRAISENPLG
jgi:hypothetical protein